jgi:hypothetical protein
VYGAISAIIIVLAESFGGLELSIGEQVHGGLAIIWPHRSCQNLRIRNGKPRPLFQSPGTLTDRCELWIIYCVYFEPEHNMLSSERCLYRRMHSQVTVDDHGATDKAKREQGIIDIRGAQLTEYPMSSIRSGTGDDGMLRHMSPRVLHGQNLW